MICNFSLLLLQYSKTYVLPHGEDMQIPDRQTSPQQTHEREAPVCQTRKEKQVSQQSTTWGMVEKQENKEGK
jgi:hypothetical protein